MPEAPKEHENFNNGHYQQEVPGKNEAKMMAIQAQSEGRIAGSILKTNEKAISAGLEQVVLHTSANLPQAEK